MIDRALYDVHASGADISDVTMLSSQTSSHITTFKNFTTLDVNEYIVILQLHACDCIYLHTQVRLSSQIQKAV